MSKKLKSKTYVRLPHKQLVPNDWNMNRMPPDKYEKLKRGIKKLLDKEQPIPPITARPDRKSVV